MPQLHGYKKFLIIIQMIVWLGCASEWKLVSVIQHTISAASWFCIRYFLCITSVTDCTTEKSVNTYLQCMASVQHVQQITRHRTHVLLLTTYPYVLANCFQYDWFKAVATGYLSRSTSRKKYKSLKKKLSTEVCEFAPRFESLIYFKVFQAAAMRKLQMATYTASFTFVYLLRGKGR